MGHFTHPLTPEGLGEKMYWPGQILPPPSCFFVMSGSLAPLFITCGQMVKLKQTSCLLNMISMVRFACFKHANFCFQMFQPIRMLKKRIVECPA